MPLIEWETNLSVGINAIDDQHKKLVSLINKLHDAMKVGKSNTVMEEILTELIKYTKEHFSFEESLFAKHGYTSGASHTKEHIELTKKVETLESDFKSGKMMLGLEVMDFLKDWLTNHIQKIDKQYSALLIEKGVK